MTTDKDTYLNSIMGMYWCGFNGFNQLNNISNNNLDFHIYGNKENYDVQQVAFSWSTASVLTSIQFNLVYFTIEFHEFLNLRFWSNCY